MKFFSHTIRLAFKPRPPDIIPWEVDTPQFKSPTSKSTGPIDYKIPDNEGEIPGHGYTFNAATGIPEGVLSSSKMLAKSLSNSPIEYGNHAREQAFSKGIDLDNHLGHLGGNFPQEEHGFNPIEVELHKGKTGNAIGKLVMRGPMQNHSDDVVLPIDVRSVGQGSMPFVKTVWPQKRNDNHRTLDLRSVHLPEEYTKGKGPTRLLASEQERKTPGYVQIPNTSANRAAILAKHNSTQPWSYNPSGSIPKT